jgi:hypothetical protein
MPSLEQEPESGVLHGVYSASSAIVIPAESAFGVL